MNAIVSGSGSGLPTGLSGESGVVVVDVRAGEAIEVPAGRWVLGADFVRQGPDLLLVGEGGEQILLKGYFALAEAPDLVLADGAKLTGDLVLKLAGPAAPGEIAQAGPAAGAEAIGKVETVEGTVTVRHADGHEAALHKGDAVFQGDVLETGPSGAIGLVFADQSTFSLAQSARMTLDEMVYDPGAQVGSFKASLVQGVFSFISGEIAKTGPDAMTISTPVATIGIRGTTGAINLPQGETLTVVLTADKGGTVGELTVFNGAGVQVLSTPFQATHVAGLNLPPSTTFTMSAQQFNSAFAHVMAALPPSPAPGGGNSGNSGGSEQGAGSGAGGEGQQGQGGEAPADGQGGEQAANGEQPAGEAPAPEGTPQDVPFAAASAAQDAFQSAMEGGATPQEAAEAAAAAGVEAGMAAAQAAFGGLPGGIEGPAAGFGPGGFGPGGFGPGGFGPGGLDGMAGLGLGGQTMGDIVGGILTGTMGGLLGQLAGLMPGGSLGLLGQLGLIGTTGPVTGDDDGDDDSNSGTQFNDFQEVLTATTGNDSLAGGDSNTNFVMNQAVDGTELPSGSLGGVDTVDGGAGTDQITFDNLQAVTGKLDAASSTLWLWNWSDVGCSSPDDPAASTTTEVPASETVTFSNMEFVKFGSYDQSADAQFPIEFAFGSSFTGYMVAGTASGDQINYDGTSTFGWFSGGNGVLVFGGEGDDFIAGGDGPQDLLLGGAGNDSLKGLGGDDEIHGGMGNDTIDGGGGYNQVYGELGDDTINISGPGDHVYGGAGNDTIDNQGSGSMTVRYTSIADFGTSGDVIIGFAGGAGNDVLGFDTSTIQVVGPYFAQASLGGGTDSLIGMIVITDDFLNYNVATAVVTQLGDFGGLAAGDHRFFATSYLSDTKLWYWSDDGNDGSVDAGELQAVATLSGCDQSSLTADNFEDFIPAAT